MRLFVTIEVEVEPNGVRASDLEMEAQRAVEDWLPQWSQLLMGNTDAEVINTDWNAKVN